MPMNQKMQGWAQVVMLGFHLRRYKSYIESSMLGAPSGFLAIMIVIFDL
jgi:hypothetical protein